MLPAEQGYLLRMTLLALILQVVGTVITGGALAFEFRSETHVRPSRMNARERKLPNPWRTNLKIGRLRSVSTVQRRQWADGRPTIGQRPMRGTDPDVIAFGEWITKWLVAREDLVAKDWDRQTELGRETRAELVHLFNEQSRLVAEQQHHMRRRVRLEMFGLLLVLVGTTLGGLSSL